MLGARNGPKAKKRTNQQQNDVPNQSLHDIFI